MDIRKISIGQDYKSSAMHYIVGQEILGGKYVIHLIQYVEDTVKSKKIAEENQDVYDKIQEGLQTKINERPYIQFIDPLKGDKKWVY